MFNYFKSALKNVFMSMIFVFSRIIGYAFYFVFGTVAMLVLPLYLACVFAVKRYKELKPKAR